MSAKHPLFDALISAKKLGNDRQLAIFMGVTAPNLSIIRAGKKQVTDQLRIKIIRKFGWSLNRIDSLAPPKKEGGK